MSLRTEFRRHFQKKCWKKCMFPRIEWQVNILLPHPIRSRPMTLTSSVFQLDLVTCLLNSRCVWILVIFAWGALISRFLSQALWDQTGKQWSQGSFSGKFAGVFVSTGSLGGGQEETGFTLITTLVHQGIVFVPLGYKHTMEELSNIEEVHGGEYLPWCIYIASSSKIIQGRLGVQASSPMGRQLASLRN